MTTPASKMSARRRIPVSAHDEKPSVRERDIIAAALGEPRALGIELESMFAQIDRNLDLADKHLASA